MHSESTCVIDPSRPCGSCLAPGPHQCPYLYLLDPDELAALAARAAAQAVGVAALAARADGVARKAPR